MSSSDRRVIFRAEGHGLSRIAISSLPNELLVELFDWCRLGDEYGWNYKRQWYNPLQVCQRWRHVMLGWAFHLKLRSLCDLASSITTIPSHLSSLPLILSFNVHRLEPPHSKQALHLALQQHDRVSAISITRWHLGDLELRSALDKTFPMLETLSLCNRGLDVLPDNFAAPRLRDLHIRTMCFSGRSFLLRNVTNLVSLRLEYTPPYDYLPPENLVEHLACMPYLEYLSLRFITRPRMVRELPHPKITRVVLPRLSTLMWAGIAPYLGDLLPQISTPFVQDFRFAIFTEETFDVLHLSEFLGTIRHLNLRATVVSFYPHAAVIAYHPAQPSIAPPYLEIRIDYTRSRACALTSVTQICNAVAAGLFSVVESLEIQLMTDYSKYQLDSGQGLFAQPAHWDSFLRSFESVKTLVLDIDLVTEISNVLCQNIEELLPMLSRLVVITVLGKEMVYQHFSLFIRTRRLSGHSVDLRVFLGRCFSLHPPPISWPFDTFGD